MRLSFCFYEAAVKFFYRLGSLFLNARIGFLGSKVHQQFDLHQVVLRSLMGFQIKEVVVRVVLHCSFKHLQKFSCFTLGQWHARQLLYSTLNLVDLHFLSLAPIPHFFIVVLIHQVDRSQPLSKAVLQESSLLRKQTEDPRLLVLYHLEDYRENLRICLVLPNFIYRHQTGPSDQSSAVLKIGFVRKGLGVKKQQHRFRKNHISREELSFVCF